MRPPPPRSTHRHPVARGSGLALPRRLRATWQTEGMTLDRPDRLILWDVDHTLIETRGVGGELYANAFQTATGVELVAKADVTGQTEPSILTATLRLYGIDKDEPYL